MATLALRRDQIEDALPTLNQWTLDHSPSSIHKSWTFDTFQTAMQFLQQVGDIAERHDHHPEFLATYTRVRIRLSTHDVDTLTDKDFTLAREIDQLSAHVFADRSQAGWM